MHAYFQSYDQNNPPYLDNSHYCFINIASLTGHTQDITYLVAVLYQEYIRREECRTTNTSTQKLCTK